MTVAEVSLDVRLQGKEAGRKPSFQTGRANIAPFWVWNCFLLWMSSSFNFHSDLLCSFLKVSTNGFLMVSSSRATSPRSLYAGIQSPHFQAIQQSECDNIDMCMYIGMYVYRFLQRYVCIYVYIYIYICRCTCLFYIYIYVIKH